MEDLVQAICVSLLLVPAPLRAGTRAVATPVVLASEHRNATESFRFRTPSSWVVETIREAPEVMEARGDSVLVRFLHRGQEVGYDSLHADCMLERLAGGLDMAPQVKYEYDFVSWANGPVRALDSAFAVNYDQPILGHRQWRQRNLTVVGDGQSLCVVTYCPVALWKKSADTRDLLERVVRSVELGPWR
jgi:hypothetical protein